MKKDIHPQYFPKAKVKCGCGNEFSIGSTKKEIEVEICSACHPFFTGKEKLIDVLQMDMAGLGFTEWRKLMPKLIETGVLTSPHTWGDPLKVYYTAQFTGGMGNIPIIEGIPSRTYDADVMLYKLEDGILSVPNAPGFGMRIKNNL